MWLEGKRNRCVDHLVYTLVIQMLPTYESRRNSQRLGFEGPNLKEKRHNEILARTPEINADAIQRLGDNQFLVTARSIAVGPCHSYA